LWERVHPANFRSLCERVHPASFRSLWARVHPASFRSLWERVHPANFRSLWERVHPANFRSLWERVHPASFVSVTTRRGTAIEPAPSHESIEVGSHRAFGWVMAAVAALVAAWAWHFDKPWFWWPVAVALGFAIAAVLQPAVLAPLNRLWMAFGHLLGRIVSPIIMGLIFFGVVTPIAILARWRGVDPMKRRFDPAAPTYWIERKPPGPDPATMERQW